MYKSGITNEQVKDYWDKKSWIFPSISNCDFCFHHRPIQQQIQAKMYPERAEWWLNIENKAGSSFGKEPLEKILRQTTLDIYEDNQSMCHCTD